jgi:hypothetical protein
MKIAILYICTGKYDVFWNEFYTSSEKYFCNLEHKHYFVFTDSQQIVDADNISIVFQDNLGWPFNTLYRYRLFLRVKEQLLQYDRVVFFNANSIFDKSIIFPEFFGVDSNLIGCIHPGFFDKSIEEYTYEKREASSAFVRKSWKYFAGGVNGGCSHQFIAVCESISQNIENDLQKGIVAIWHDESHWNAYLNNNYLEIKDRLHILTPAYLYPENWDLPFEKKIVLRDKNKFGGHSLLRGITKSSKLSLINHVKILLRKLFCK